MMYGTMCCRENHVNGWFGKAFRGCGTGVETCKVRTQPGKELVELHHVQQSVQAGAATLSLWTRQPPKARLHSCVAAPALASS